MLFAQEGVLPSPGGEEFFLIQFSQYQESSPKGTSLVVQWLRLHASDAGGLGSISGQGRKSHMLQLRLSTAKYTHKWKYIYILISTWH